MSKVKIEYEAWTLKEFLLKLEKADPREFFYFTRASGVPEDLSMEEDDFNQEVEEKLEEINKCLFVSYTVSQCPKCQMYMKSNYVLDKYDSCYKCRSKEKI